MSDKLYPGDQPAVEYLLNHGWSFLNTGGTRGMSINEGPKLPYHEAYAMQKYIDTLGGSDAAVHDQYHRGKVEWFEEHGFEMPAPPAAEVAAS